MADALDLLIARGPPPVDFSALGDLPKAYWEGLGQKYTQTQRDLFQGGLPKDASGRTDYGKIAEMMIQSGGAPAVQQGLPILGMALTQQRQDILGGGQGGQPPSQTISPSISRPGGGAPPQLATSEESGPFNGPRVTLRGLVLRANGGNEQAAAQTTADIASQHKIDPDAYLSRDEAIRVVQTLRGGQVAQAPEAQQAAQPQQAPQAPATFGDRFGAAYGNPPVQVRQQQQSGQPPGAEPTLSDPTLGGVLEGQWIGKPQAQLRVLRQFMSDPNLPKNEQENYKQQVENIVGALKQERDARLKEPEARGKGRGEYYIKKFETIAADGDKARASLNTLDAAEQIMQQPGFYSGPANAQVLLLKQAAAAIGADPNAASSMESFRGLANRTVFDTLGGLGNQISEGDRKFVIGAFPSLENTPQGNKVMIEIMRRMNARKLEVSKAAQNYKDGNLDVGFDRMVSKYAEETPLFPKNDPIRSLGKGAKSAPASGGFTEGQTATNPKTGKQKIFRNGAWADLL